MKMIYNGTPIKSLNIKHYEMNTNDATLKASDMQVGVTAYAKGKKVTGTGKCFSFAMYGNCPSNTTLPVPTSEINTIIVAANTYPVKMKQTILTFQEVDFSTAQEVATITINGEEYLINLQIINNMLTISCNQTVTLQVLFGKDDYV